MRWRAARGHAARTPSARLGARELDADVRGHRLVRAPFRDDESYVILPPSSERAPLMGFDGRLQFRRIATTISFSGRMWWAHRRSRRAGPGDRCVVGDHEDARRLEPL
jgi:hypothetical protein